MVYRKSLKAVANVSSQPIIRWWFMPRAALSSWRVLGASVAGSGHRQRGQLCQDAHAHTVTAGGTLVLAAADGASSALHAGQGAQTAVSAVCARAQELLAETRPDLIAQGPALLRDLLQHARAELERTAQGLGCALPELAATLILVLVQGEQTAWAQVGDGGVVAWHADGSWQALTVPWQGEYLNETTFLTRPDYAAEIQLGSCEQAFQGLVLFTDGLQRLALHWPQQQPHPGFFAPLVAHVRSALDMEKAEQELCHFLLSPRLSARSDDDLTLLLAVAGTCS